jgi:hypothetical protein
MLGGINTNTSRPRHIQNFVHRFNRWAVLAERERNIELLKNILN